MVNQLIINHLIRQGFLPPNIFTTVCGIMYIIHYIIENTLHIITTI